MKERRVLGGAAVAILLALAAGLTLAQSPQGTPLGTVFTYQGQLKKDGAPQSTPCDFQFTLWDAESAGTQVGPLEDETGVDITGGFFTVQLDFGEGAFQGEARWLEIAVQCPGDPGYTTLTPRQALTPAPYALALPGLSTQQGITSTNLIGGFSGNWVADGVEGATISGGGGAGDDGPNSITGWYGTIGGGRLNQAAYAATVGGGLINQALGERATIGGGRWNTASSVFATIGGGSENTADGEGSTVGGGRYNLASGPQASISGGYGNTAGGYASTVGAGEGNIASGEGATVSGGLGNTADQPRATIGGGTYNAAGGWAATVSGGITNTASGALATVGGGRQNRAEGHLSIVGGGEGNTASGDHATVSGGITNTASLFASTVGGGKGNQASGDWATIAGGDINTASAYASTVAGGGFNVASGERSTIGGGMGNTAGSKDSTVAGGLGNAASGSWSAVGGGWDNIASGVYATIPGGSNNRAQGDHSFAAGSRTRAYNQGCFVWGDTAENDVVCDVDNRWVARASGGVAFLSSADNNNGVFLSPGGNSWSGISDRALKENLSPADGPAILETLASLPVQEYNLKSQDDSIRHIGLVAQDFATFGYGESDTAINMQDADGVALAAIQGLYAENQALKAQLSGTEARLAALELGTAGAHSAQTGAHLPVPWLAVGGLVMATGALAGWRRRSGGRQ